jgi:Pyruvate phosphate dikinase, AMP/ATP-binding domain
LSAHRTGRPLAGSFAATEAVLRSWNAEKAVSYRRLNRIDDAAGTAVTMQTMVFGNAGGTSGAAVGFTRNPATGARDFLPGQAAGPRMRLSHVSSARCAWWPALVSRSTLSIGSAG